MIDPRFSFTPEVASAGQTERRKAPKDQEIMPKINSNRVVAYIGG